MTWVAVVDIGSLSTQLVLTDGRQRRHRTVDTFMDASTLSPAGEVQARPITEEALRRVGAALADFRRQSDEHDAEIRVVATAAARRAPNRSDLAELVELELAAPLTVIDSDEEARLALIGAGATEAAAGAVTIDLGGGSTDVGYGTAGGLDAAWSMPLGASLVTRAYLHSDPPQPEELSAALSVVELHIDDLRREHPAVVEALGDPDTAVIGLGGVVTVAALEVGLLDDDPLNADGDGPLHGFELTREAVEDVFRTIATEARADRLHNPGLPAARVDDVVGGCVVLVEMMRQLDLDALTVSQRGLADGVAAEWGRAAC